MAPIYLATVEQNAIPYLIWRNTKRSVQLRLAVLRIWVHCMGFRVRVKPGALMQFLSQWLMHATKAQPDVCAAFGMPSHNANVLDSHDTTNDSLCSVLVICGIA